MASDAELHILSLMKSSKAGDVLSSVLAYLRPFQDLLKSREEERSVAPGWVRKQFLPFLTKSVSLLEKRLSVKVADESPEDLFRAYDFSLDCYELISLKPKDVQLHRVALIRCYLTWGCFTHAYNDSFRVLHQLTGPNSDRLLPNPHFGVANIVLFLVRSIVRSVALSPDMEDHQYSRVSLLLHEIKPWLIYFDANARDAFLSRLVLDMGTCALSVIREAERFRDNSFPHSFCITTLENYSASPLPKDQFYKFARQLLSLLFLSKETKTIDIVTSVLRTVASDFKNELREQEPQNNWLELVDLVSFCAHESQLVGKVWSARFSEQLREIAAEAIPQASVILRLYSLGLSVNVFHVKFGEETTGLADLLADKDIWNSLVSLLGIIDQYTSDSQGQTYVKMGYPLRYLDALKFLCQPLASLVNSENTKLVLETQIACDSRHLSAIQDTFLLFFQALPLRQRWMPDKEGSGTDFDKILPNMAMAAFIVMIRTQLKQEITVCLIEDVFATTLITPPELKYLFTSLHDIGVALYTTQHLKKASMVFRVCIRTVWTCIIRLCQIFVNESNSSEDTLSGQAIIDFVRDACINSALYLDVLHQHDARGIEKLAVFILENWSAAEDLIKRLPDPTPIINQCLKIQGIHPESPDLAGTRTPLYSLLSSSQKISIRLTKKILEQELVCYEETLPLRSELCRARILIWKAKRIRASGSAHLQECIHYLSEAISISGSISNVATNNLAILCCHQLAVAHCLRALCLQETDPNSKQVFQDCNTSVNLWLWIGSPCESEDSIPLENTIPLLSSFIDLLAIKGWIELHQQIYELMFRLLRWKKVKLEACLAMLWDCRRLSHAMCPCPISDAVILGLSKHFGEKSESTEFWISCLEFSKAKSVGFQLSLQSSLYATLHTLNKHEDPYTSNITIDDIKSTASELVSRDPSPSHSSFVAASLYYDLCERQLPCGNYYEALSYAEEAHRIRRILFENMFSGAGQIIKTPTGFITKVEVSSSKATNVWPCGEFVWDPNRCYLSHWNVLQCYLESLLQVGLVYELIGEQVKAEGLLTLGKSISSVQSLAPFMIAFSLALGKLYTRKPSLDLAIKELLNAQGLLEHTQVDYSCRICKPMIEATLYKQLGDFSQRQHRLSLAQSMLYEALRTFCCSAWNADVNMFLVPESDPGINENQTDNNQDSKKGNTQNTVSSICICINRKCPQGLPNKVIRSGWLNSLISLKWQFHQRRLACAVLHSLGKSLATSGRVHEAHEAMWQSIAVLGNSDVSSLSPLLDFIDEEIKRDVFGVDRARMLYNLCKLSLQTRWSRSICCDLSHTPLEKLVSWLKVAFVLSREAPILCQKISRLLAALYSLYYSSGEFSLPCDDPLTVSHWVAYYHQASLGAHINHQFLSKFRTRYKSDKECSGLSCMATAELDFLRPAPESTEDLAKFAMNFFNSLSESTVVCISMLGGTLSKILQEIAKSPPVCAWLLVSRLSSKSLPVTILLPVDSVLKEDDDCNRKATESKEKGKGWVCPWGSTVVGDVAPTFESILEEDFMSHYELPKLRGEKKEQLDFRLAKFLRKLEDSWFGPWRHLLLGDSSYSILLETTQKKLIEELRSKCMMEVDESLVKTFLQTGTNEFEGEAWISQLDLKRDHSTSKDVQSRYALALQLIREAEIEVRQKGNKEKREAIILVLAHEIQMLPWESIPVLRNQEVYRMPSVGSISAVLKNCCSREDPARCLSSPFPVIDPGDAYYLLNPRGDLNYGQTVFESWFKKNGLEGRAGVAPAAGELSAALEKHDLFIYIGPGTGERYIPMSQVKNMDKCAATFLMGCYSGSPYMRGTYVPISFPVSFLLAGSPVVVANLWSITHDVIPFGRAMLEGWLGETSADDTSQRVGSFMADARNACRLQFLTGAAPVCYGVPTAIIKKKKPT